MNAANQERGLRLLGLWPGPFDGVAAAPSRAAAAAELANVKALAKTAKRVVARRKHPDLAGKRGNQDELRAAIEAAEWVEAARLDEIWPPRRQARERDVRRRPGSPIEIEVSATGIRIAYRGET